MEKDVVSHYLKEIEGIFARNTQSQADEFAQGLRYCDCIREELQLNQEASGKRSFTEDELALAKKLAYENGEKASTELGFVHNDVWITNPFMDSTGRFELTDLSAMCDYYSSEKVYDFLSKILNA